MTSLIIKKEQGVIGEREKNTILGGGWVKRKVHRGSKLQWWNPFSGG